MNLKSKIGLGSVQFGIPYGISNTSGQTKPGEVKQILAFAAANNITTIDSASSYGNAEAVLGESRLENFQIVSKYFNPPADVLIETQLSKTLADLNVFALHGYLAHRPMEIITNPAQWDELNDFKARGLVNKIGFSLNQPAELIQLLEKGFVPDIIQVPYNYFDNRFENLMQQVKKNGCEVHCRSAFLQGLFFKEPVTLPAFFEEVNPILAKLQATFKHLLSGLLLNFVAQNTYVDKVIVGIENVQQLQQNLDALQEAGEFHLPGLEVNIKEEILMPSNWPKL